MSQLFPLHGRGATAKATFLRTYRLLSDGIVEGGESEGVVRRSSRRRDAADGSPTCKWSPHSVLARPRVTTYNCSALPQITVAAVLLECFGDEQVRDAREKLERAQAGDVGTRKHRCLEQIHTRLPLPTRRRHGTLHS